MAGDTIITVVGNLTADPELRYTHNGLAVANFTIASTPRIFDRQANEWKDGEALFLRASVWREFAEHVASSMQKGSRVIAQGRLKQRSYETKEGEKRTSYELDIDEIGPSLRYATAQVTRTSGGSGSGGAQRAFGGGNAGGNGGSSAPAQRQAPAADPWGQPQAPQGGGNGGWATPGATNDFDEPPF
ncbi:MAG: single-stranded DNA-binding protein [Pseudoclavibacter sp.]